MFNVAIQLDNVTIIIKNSICIINSKITAVGSQMSLKNGDLFLGFSFLGSKITLLIQYSPFYYF